MDVDAILPEVHMSAIEADDSFWNAIEKTNDQLQSTGLYLTHLFTDAQVIIQPDWLNNLSPIYLPSLQFLKLLRPSTEDLILTKMMRVDPQDRSDILFLLSTLKLGMEDLEILVQNARVPAILEIQQAFIENANWLHTLKYEGMG